MLEFDFQSSPVDQYADVIKKAGELAASSNRLAVEFLVSRIGICVSKTKNEPYLAEALNYLRGHIFAQANMPTEAAGAIAASNVLPYSGGGALFHDAVTEGVALARAQDAAINGGVPPILLSSMPRAASAALTQTLSGITGAPIFRVSIGAFPNDWLVPVWLSRFLRGGAILHDHFGATDYNLDLLRKFQVEAVNLLVRDPRAAAVSFAKFVFGLQTTQSDIDHTYSNCYIPWLLNWIDAERLHKINIRWIRSSDVIGDSDSLNTVITTILSTQSPFVTSAKNVTLATANLSKQKSDAWRESVSPELQKKMWDLVPAEIIQRLELNQ
jgi:hypothetical protein